MLGFLVNITAFDKLIIESLLQNYRPLVENSTRVAIEADFFEAIAGILCGFGVMPSHFTKFRHSLSRQSSKLTTKKLQSPVK
jgi:hypothetical protein